MISDLLKSRLSLLLENHGEVVSISTIPTDPRASGCMLLATMKSQQDTSKLQRQFGFQTFGYNSLIISKEWVTLHLTD